MELCYIRQDYLNKLKSDFFKNINLNKYSLTSPFIYKDYDDRFILKSNIITEDINLKFYTDRRSNSSLDIENAKELYLKLKNLTPRQAADERLWQYLLHTTFWEYMRYRWPLDKKNKNNDHYFSNDKNDRFLIRHGIARLWWITHETYDADASNPFHLTEFVFSDQDYIRTIIERSFCRNKLFTKKLLICIKQYFDENNKYTKKRYAIRYLMEEINKLAAINVIEYLPINILNSIIVELFDNYYKKQSNNLQSSEQLSLPI